MKKKINKLSPFAIHKGVKGIAEDNITIERQFSDDIYLTCSKKSLSNNLLKYVLFGNVAPVVVTQHKSLNTSKGVIRNWELARTNPEEIKGNVPSIIDVQRITVKINNMEVKTNTLILTFNSPKIPESLKICYLNIPVSQYVPNPLRCYKCQRFGHVTSKCKHSETVPNARKLATRMNRVQRHLNASIVEKIMLHTARNVLFIKRNMIYNPLECLVIFLFLKLV